MTQKPFYMSGVVNFLTKEQANELVPTLLKPALIKGFPDGTYSVVKLSITPIQHGQVPYRLDTVAYKEVMEDIKRKGL